MGNARSKGMRTITDNQPGVGVLFTSALDENTCPGCRAADDGVVRAYDDPLRIARRPPYSACTSDVGRRCMEVHLLSGDPRARAFLAEQVCRDIQQGQDA